MNPVIRFSRIPYLKAFTFIGLFKVPGHLVKNRLCIKKSPFRLFDPALGDLLQTKLIGGLEVIKFVGCFRVGD